MTCMPFAPPGGKGVGKGYACGKSDDPEQGARERMAWGGNAERDRSSIPSMPFLDGRLSEEHMTRNKPQRWCGRRQLD